MVKFDVNWSEEGVWSAMVVVFGILVSIGVAVIFLKQYLGGG